LARFAIVDGVVLGLGLYFALAGIGRAAPADSPAADDPAVQVRSVTVQGREPPVAGGPTVSATGANDYRVTAQDIALLPTGDTSPITDILAQMPGVAIDQNQQIHIRNTEGPQFQYQIDGVLVPLDINTNPPFLSMINPLFVKQVDLLDGVLPARYSYATGGVIDIQSKDGCDVGGAAGAASLQAGQRETLQPAVQYGGCDGRFGYFVSALYRQGETAFSQPTTGPEPIHNFTNQGQVFGHLTYGLTGDVKLSLTFSAAASDNQLPDTPGLTPRYILAGVPSYSSANINSYLNFRDYLAILALNGSSGSLTYQFAYSAHFITQDFRPDNAGELIFQGVASTATHYDIDNTLEGDLSWRLGAHTFSAGFYAGNYRVTANDSSLVFPVYLTGDRPGPRILAAGVGGVVGQAVPPTLPENPNGPQSSTTPELVVDDIRADNVVLGLYLGDTWRITPALTLDAGLRLDSLSGFTRHIQLDPTANLSLKATADLTLHAGFARYMQAPSFQGISPYAPDAFAGTTAAGIEGVATPLTEDDEEWDTGLVQHFGPRLTLSQDLFYEVTFHYLDTGQLGVVPIFAPFNYDHGHIWGSETALSYRDRNLTAHLNLTLGKNQQKGVATGQFNFDTTELAYIDRKGIRLDHQPGASVSAGGAYRWRAWLFSLSGIYSSGLASGFADTQSLPSVVQINAALERKFHVPRVGQVSDRLTFVNLFDRVNPIRPAEGIGIFQAAYGPRFTLLDTVTVPF
jgi:hypothetical protein